MFLFVALRDARLDSRGAYVHSERAALCASGADS